MRYTIFVNYFYVAATINILVDIFYSLISTSHWIHKVNAVMEDVDAYHEQTLIIFEFYTITNI